MLNPASMVSGLGLKFYTFNPAPLFFSGDFATNSNRDKPAFGGIWNRVQGGAR
jgi:hypothetical protein